MSQTTLDIKEPGLNVLPPGVERHVVNAGGLTGLQIFPDDEIEIINEEGIIEKDYCLLKLQNILHYYQGLELKKILLCKILSYAPLV